MYYYIKNFLYLCSENFLIKNIMFRIKEICNQKGLTLQELSKRLNINYQSLHSAITGNPTTETLKKIADVLNVRIVDLFNQETQPKVKCPACGEILTLQFV